MKLTDEQKEIMKEVEEFFFHQNITDYGKKQTKGGWRHLVLLQVTKERQTDQ